MTRSWLFAPGHNERDLARVFSVGADEVLLDLEDAVPSDIRTARARWSPARLRRSGRGCASTGR